MSAGLGFLLFALGFFCGCATPFLLFHFWLMRDDTESFPKE